MYTILRTYTTSKQIGNLYIRCCVSFTYITKFGLSKNLTSIDILHEDAVIDKRRT